MKSQLIATAITIAIALTASSSFAVGAPAAAPAASGTSNAGASAGSNAGTHVGSNAGTSTGSNAGMNVGSNAGTNVGSNAGTHAGSNAGTTVGSNAGTNVGSNAGTHVGSNAPVNTVNNTNHTLPPNNQAANRDNHARRLRNGILVFPGFFSGDYGVYDNTGSSADYSANSDTNAATPGSTAAKPMGQPSANTATIPPAQLSPDGGQTTANVPPPQNFSNGSPQAAAVSPRPTQFEGQLVDLYSATETKPTAAAHPAPAADTKATHQVAAPVVGKSPTAGLTENVGSVSNISENSFGTPSRPGTLTPAPESSPTVSTNKPEVSVIVPSGNPTVPARTFDNAAITKELNAGMPAAIIVNHRVYTLVCDPKQLAPYAGQTLRVTGHITESGALVPDRIENQTAGKFHQIALQRANLNNSVTAEDR